MPSHLLTKLVKEHLLIIFVSPLEAKSGVIALTIYTGEVETGESLSHLLRSLA